jgi:ELWxxDGT repeat protein
MKKSIFSISIMVFVLIVHAQETFTLIEINPLHGNSPLTVTTDSAKTYYGAGALSGFTAMNGKLYFSAQGTPGDDELWVTDGTIQGTSLVKAINPGQGAALGNLVYVNNHILFMATDNDTTWDLWSTDGTDTGTLKIAALGQPTNSALGPYNVSTMGNRLLFCSKQDLLITDGTSLGTNTLLSIAGYSQGFGYCENSGQSYFILPEVSGGNDIWRSDGTTVGTQSVLSLDTTSFNITSVNSMVSSNGKIYLSAAPTGQSSDLFSFEGTINGQLKRIPLAASGNSSPHDFVLYDSVLYFIANNGTTDNIYGIAPSDTMPVALISNANFSSLGNLSFANNTAYCMDSNTKQIHSMALTGFTHSVLNLTGYSLPAFHSTNYPFLVGMNGLIYFEAYDSATGDQVFMQSDFTPMGTTAVMPAGANTIHPFNSILGSGTIEDVFDLRTWGNQILLPANFNDAGRELWIFDPGSATSINEVKRNDQFTIYPNPASNELTIETDLNYGMTHQLSIVNIYGQVVMQQVIETGVTTIALSSLGSGAYFVKLDQNGQTTGAQKLVVVK